MNMNKHFFCTKRTTQCFFTQFSCCFFIAFRCSLFMRFRIFCFSAGHVSEAALIAARCVHGGVSFPLDNLRRIFRTYVNHSFRMLACSIFLFLFVNLFYIWATTSTFPRVIERRCVLSLGHLVNRVQCDGHVFRKILEDE